MNTDMWVPIEVIASFNGVKALHASVDQIASIMRGSEVVSVSSDGKMIRPNMKLERKTLILRDVSTIADAKDVSALFESSPESERPVELTSAPGDNW
jgi:hypothetical protein